MTEEEWKMKKLIAFLLAFATAFTALCVGASAFFEPMELEEMEAELAASPSEAAMAFAWEFDDAPTEVKEYRNNIPETIAALTDRGWHTYTEESDGEVEARDIEKLVGAGTLLRKNSTRKATVFKFSDSASAEAFCSSLKTDGHFAQSSDVYVVFGDESTVLSVVRTEVSAAVKNTYCTSAEGYEILDGAFLSANKSSVGGIQFRTPDAAIRLEDGELVIGKAQKDCDSESYISRDAYMDVYVAGVDYNKAHSTTAGKDFVLTASVRAPFNYNTSKSTVEVFRTRSAFNDNTGKVTLDATLVAYNSDTREIIIYSDGAARNTGIYLSDYDYTSVAVHVHPKENKFDFYADGILIVKDAVFLTDAKREKIVSASGNAPSGNTADYTLTRLRLFYSGIKALSGDIICVDNFAWYYSDEYLERSSFDKTVLGISADIKEKLYLNFYMNFPRATISDYNAALEASIGTERESLLLISGTPVEGGEFDGCMKYSVALDFTDLAREISLRLVSEGRLLYFYSQDLSAEFLGKSEYKTSAEKYFKYLCDEKNGFDQKTRNLARAVLNFGAALQKRENPKIAENLLPNKGVEYTADEYGGISQKTLREEIDSDAYKVNGYYGSIFGMTLTSYAFSSDKDGLYLKVTYNYVGRRSVSVNGEEVLKNSIGAYEYKIYIKHFLLLDDVYTLTLWDGKSGGYIKFSAYHIAANILASETAQPHAVEFAKSLHLYVKAAEEYLNKTNGETEK